MKRILYIFFIIFFISSCVFAKSDIYSEEYLQKCHDYLIQKERFNAINYNALQLSPEQIDKYEDITECDKNSYKEKLSQITKEVQKYNVMKDCNLPKEEINKQKQIIRKLHRELSKISHQEDKKLKKIFTREQRKTYNMIKHLERHDLKADMYPKNYQKLNPKMSVFGNLQE